MDEAPLDPSLASYRERLLDAVERKSEAMLLPLLADDIRISFGDAGGVEAFRNKWTTSSPESPLWNELDKLLQLGGAFRGEGEARMFWAPYVYARWPDGIDAFEHLAAIRTGVPLRERPDEAAPLVATLDWQIVRLTKRTPVEGWRNVRTVDDVEGWVSSNDVRSPIDYRAGFQRIGGEWTMTALVAGD